MMTLTTLYTPSVANIKTTAVKDSDGNFIVNGEKKWITNGVFADFFTVAVRTGEAGMRGISMMLLEKGMEGIECNQMKCMGVWSSGTTYITFGESCLPL
jgi:alkylation response protein AidB-like acyl-CoA dehydrogenase